MNPSTSSRGSVSLSRQRGLLGLRQLRFRILQEKLPFAIDDELELYGCRRHCQSLAAAMARSAKTLPFGMMVSVSVCTLSHC